MNIELYNGMITISTIHNNVRVKQRYEGYTISEAKKRFKLYLKTL